MEVVDGDDAVIREEVDHRTGHLDPFSDISGGCPGNRNLPVVGTRSGRSMAPCRRSGGSDGLVGPQTPQGRMTSKMGLKRQMLAILTKVVAVRVTERPSKKAGRPWRSCRGEFALGF